MQHHLTLLAEILSSKFQPFTYKFVWFCRSFDEDVDHKGFKYVVDSVFDLLPADLLFGALHLFKFDYYYKLNIK